MTSPQISVIMGVYNGEKNLARTIESILQQTNVSFEFIIVNDGSSDNSQRIVESYIKKDSRITLINQHNRGLTLALVAGCNRANGRYLARQDVGDISLQGRLSAQYKALEDNPNASLISTSSKFITPDGEELYTIAQTSEEATRGLHATTINTLRGPSHHGSTMFPRERYNLVGGYRKAFSVAQDLDLWTRLAEHGDVLTIGETYYYATVEKDSISTSKRSQQIRTAKYILLCCEARSKHGNDQAILSQLDRVNSAATEVAISQRQLDSAYYYFIGSNLLNSDPLASLKYFKKSMRLTPLHWKTLVKIVYTYLALIKHRAKLLLFR